MNYVHLVGRLGRDPESRFTTDGKKVWVLVVATNSYRNGNEETIWWRVTFWGDRWDKMMQHFSKGKPVMIGGEMRKPETYTDKAGLVQLGSIDVTGEYLKFVPFGRQDQDEQGGQQGQSQGYSQGQASGYAAPTQQQPQQQQPTAAPAPASPTMSPVQGTGAPVQDEEPLPF